MQEEKRFARRSLLYVPASSPKKLEKALSIDADGIIMDLEDAVSLSEKEHARTLAMAWIGKLKESGKEILVRINGLDSFLGVLDLIAIVKAVPHTIILPKADVKTVEMADMLLSMLEAEEGLSKGTIALVPLLETADGILSASDILAAATRINGVQLGAEDLTKELSIPRTTEGQEIAFARQMLVYAARQANIDSFDTPFTGIHDEAGMRTDAENAKNMGFTGKTCIYPTHALWINEIFRPKAEEVAFARRLVEAFRQAEEAGKGACMFEGKMIDRPIAQRAEKMIEKETLIALAERKERI